MKANIAIREALHEDLISVWEIEKSCFAEESFSRRSLAYLISEANGVFYLAEYAGEISAYISLLLNRRYNNARIYSIAVAPKFRGNGIAEILMDKVLEFSYQNQIKSIFLEVSVNNNAAISLYKKKGFQEHSLKKNYYKDGSDAYSMCLNLMINGK